MLIEIIERVECPATGLEEPIDDCRRCEHHRYIFQDILQGDDCQYDDQAAERERQDELAASRIWSEK